MTTAGVWDPKHHGIAARTKQDENIWCFIQFNTISIYFTARNSKRSAVTWVQLDAAFCSRCMISEEGTTKLHLCSECQSQGYEAEVLLLAAGCPDSSAYA